MAEIKAFFEASSSVRIEAEGAGPGTSSAYATDFFGALSSIAEAVVAQVNRMPREQRPADLTIGFGLKALSGGGFAVSLNQDTANFRISLSWRTEGQELTPGAFVPGSSAVGL
jgi:hypothetical protein